MPLISRYDKAQRPWRRTTGIYGHLPKYTMHGYEVIKEGHSAKFCRTRSGCDGCEKLRRVRLWWPCLTYVGYLVLITKGYTYQFWYMGNPYRHKIFERHANGR